MWQKPDITDDNGRQTILHRKQNVFYLFYFKCVFNDTVIY